MTKRMLIDATHAEETRVVVLDGNRLEDFDVETSTKKQLKGNIYLAKVVRVEPSLQAAFVEYGGNRHGFLAFGEIHPDYYQIPVADRQRLLDMQAEDARREQEDEDREALEVSAEEYSTEDDGGASGHAAERPAEVPDDARELDAPDTIEAASTEAHPLPRARAQPIRIDPETVSGAITAAPAENSETFRVPAAAAQSETTLVNPPATESAQSPMTPELDLITAASPVEMASDGATARPIESIEDAAPDTVMPGDVVPPDDAVSPAPDADYPATDEPDTEPSGVGEPETGLSDPIDADADAEGDMTLAAPPPETVGGDSDGGDDSRERRIPPRFLRNYKIQEVVRRRQILLIQVVKEERGTKGAALTTYVSLAGRYCVLMPNSPRGGGISRKITSASDRRRLKEVTAELDIPNGMGLIVRTAGANRPKPEIKRDCEYLMRLWDDIREHTMKSVAPALIYEEASLIKRAIRDVYARDIDEIQVDGEDGWKAARDFMRMLMPSHVKKVQLWRDSQPLFARHQVENQLDGMLSPTVQLRSGGYLVINQTEALVAIDVNSGRSTRERGIEETALRTNLEAVDEVARQLRLRDLAGLIVIDLIDMEGRKHNTMVERRLKDALKTDRARIQVGQISHFGLMEMSRQRLRPSLAETSFVSCPHCGGTGHVRGTESAAIHVLRDIEEEGSKRRAAEILVRAATPIAMYILNHKRARLTEIETRYAMQVTFVGDDSLIPPQVRIERVRVQAVAEGPVGAPIAVTPDARPEPDLLAENLVAAEDDLEDGDEDGADDENASPGAESAEDAERRHRRRRRRRRGGRRDDAAAVSGESAGSEPSAVEQFARGPDAPGASIAPSVDATGNLDTADLAEHIEGVPEHTDATPDADGVDAEARGRRRGRRGGRRRRRDGSDGGVELVAELGAEQPELPPIYNGPTPANPFGGQAFDIFDVLEQAEQAADRPVTAVRPSAATPDYLPEQVPETHIERLQPIQAESEPEPVAEIIAEPSVTEADPMTAVPLAPMIETATGLVPANDVAPAPLIKPIVVGGAEDAPMVEKKRGWWHR